MSIRFACACGQQLVAADDYAGKRVRCTVCGASRTVPGGEANVNEDEAAAMVHLVCTSCGQTCQARPEHAGKNSRCPLCGTLLTIPAGAAGLRGPLADAFQAELSLAVAPPLALAAVGTHPPAEGGGQGQPRTIKKPDRRLWLVVTAVAILLFSVGLGLLLHGGGISDDFDLVPRDAQGFATVRVADLLHTPLGNKTLANLDEHTRAEINNAAQAFGLDLAHFERVTVVLADGDNEVFWVIVKTLRPYDRNKLLGSRAVETIYAGKKYYRTDSVTLHFVSDTVAVVGPEQGVRRCLDQPAKPRGGPLKEALKAASIGDVQAAAGSNVPEDLGKRVHRAWGGRVGVQLLLNRLAPLFGVRVAYVTAKVGQDIDWAATLAFPDQDRASKGKEAAGDVLGLARTPLPLLRPTLELLPSPLRVPKEDLEQMLLVAALAQKQLDEVRPTQDDKDVVLRGKVSGSDLLQALDILHKQAQRRR